jgi:hypothetical protein
MSDNEHTEWIQNLIAEAEAWTPPAAPKAPKPRVRPTIVKSGESTYATVVQDDGLVSYVTVDGPGWKL